MTNLFRSLISNPLIRAQVFSVLRHLLTLGGGMLIAYGVLPKGSNVEEIVGALLTLISIVLAQYDVSGVNQKIIAASNAGPQNAAQAADALKQGKF